MGRDERPRSSAAERSRVGLGKPRILWEEDSHARSALHAGSTLKTPREEGEL